MRKAIKIVLGQIVAVLLLLLIWFPLLYVILTSFRNQLVLFSTEFYLIPREPTLAAYRRILIESDFLIWGRNSFVVTASTTIVSVSLGSLAGYALSHFRFPGRNAGLQGIVILHAFPGIFVLIPLFLIMYRLGLVGKHLGLVVVYTAGLLVFCLWNLKGFFDTIPREIYEAALIDGASPTTSFLKVILPLSKPGLAVTAVFSFLAGWNEYIAAQTLLFDEKLYTLPVGIYGLQQIYSTPWPDFAAASLLVAIPVMAVFMLLQRYLKGGLTLGALK